MGLLLSCWLCLNAFRECRDKVQMIGALLEIAGHFSVGVAV